MLTENSPGIAANLIVCLDDLRLAIAPVREELLMHPVYEAVDTIPRLEVFMSHHVFAVWDFMCLAKRLQRDLTSLDELWIPPQRPALSRFINGVIHGEESDVDQHGQATSHFGLYLGAMTEVGASVAPAQRFIEMLREGFDAQSALKSVGAPPAARRFVAHTLDVVKRGTTIQVLANFLFGREDLIPEMFSRLLAQWEESNRTHRFAYYIQRHIELDGDEHGPAGLRALAEIAGSDNALWLTAKHAAQSAMVARIQLWDGVHAAFSE